MNNFGWPKIRNPSVLVGSCPVKCDYCYFPNSCSSMSVWFFHLPFAGCFSTLFSSPRFGSLRDRCRVFAFPFYSPVPWTVLGKFANASVSSSRGSDADSDAGSDAGRAYILLIQIRVFNARLRRRLRCDCIVIQFTKFTSFFFGFFLFRIHSLSFSRDFRLEILFGYILN